MALHVYDDELLTRQLSEGDMTAPDFALLEGEQGSYSDKQLYLAAEHTTLAEAVSDNATVLIVQDAGRFRNGETIAVGEEQMLILDGGGTTQFTVQRGYNDTAPVGHNAGARVTSGYLYYLFGILGIEVSGEQTYPALWCRLAFTREGLDSAGAVPHDSPGQRTGPHPERPGHDVLAAHQLPARNARSVPPGHQVAGVGHRTAHRAALRMR